MHASSQFHALMDVILICWLKRHICFLEGRRVQPLVWHCCLIVIMKHLSPPAKLRWFQILLFYLLPGLQSSVTRGLKVVSALNLHTPHTVVQLCTCVSCTMHMLCRTVHAKWPGGFNCLRWLLLAMSRMQHLIIPQDVRVMGSLADTSSGGAAVLWDCWAGRRALTHRLQRAQAGMTVCTCKQGERESLHWPQCAEHTNDSELSWLSSFKLYLSLIPFSAIIPLSFTRLSIFLPSFSRSHKGSN